MTIDPHHLPDDAAVLRQIVLHLLQMVEDKDRLLERVQHQLEQLLRHRYGQKREHIDENQLFLFAAHIVAAMQAGTAPAATPSSDSAAPPDAAAAKKPQRPGHGRKPL